MRAPIMVVYILIAVSAIVVYLSLLGDGTRRPGK
jgi:hypothetical protein